MNYVIYEKASGAINSVRFQQNSADGISNGAGIIDNLYGADGAAIFAAVPYTGNGFPAGKKIDVATRTLVDDPDYVPPAPVPAPAPV